jgi:hypothetical protein
MKALFAALCLAGPLLIGGSGFACEGTNVVFEDKFQDDSGGWDPADSIKFGATGLDVDVGAEFTNFKELNSAFAVGDADICIDVAFPKTIANNPSVGIMFWAVDYSNFYLFQVSQAGSASLWRMNNSKWNKIFSGDVAAIKKDAGAVNTLRVTVKSGTITAYVNGEKVRSQKAQAPKADSQFGLYVQVDDPVAEADGRIFNVTNYKVTDAP